MAEPSPERRVFRWAWYHAARQRSTYLISSVVFSVIAAIVGALIVPPAHASGLKRTLFALAGVGIASAAVGVMTYMCALVIAPFQQRNELRRRLVGATTHIRELENAPVSPAHAERLREIATTLSQSINAYEPPAYSSSDNGDSRLLKTAFLEHFPDLNDPLEALESVGDAQTALRTRLVERTVALGMDRHPWLHTSEIPVLIAAVISARSMQRAQSVNLDFHWQEVDDEIYWGGIDHGTPVIYVDNADDAAKRKQTFERFVREADTWPEAAAIWEIFERRMEAREQAIRLLQVIANRDTITGRCQLCIASTAV